MNIKKLDPIHARLFVRILDSLQWGNLFPTIECSAQKQPTGSQWTRVFQTSHKLATKNEHVYDSEMKWFLNAW